MFGSGPARARSLAGIREVIEAHGKWPGHGSAARVDPEIDGVVSALRERFGEGLVAVLLYGSYLRGARDTVLDFYVVVDGYAGALRSPFAACSAWLLPPNVYYETLGNAEERVRAKYAVVTLAQLGRNACGLHPYFWARFAQPCHLVHTRDDEARRRVLGVCEQSVRTFVRRIAAGMRGEFTARDFWLCGFGLTYRAELRAESGGRPTVLFDEHVDYYAALLDSLAHGFTITGSGGIYRSTGGSTGVARVRWGLVIGVGKMLSLLRLVKAAVTFDDPLEYVLWKIERHSGIRAEATPRQRRYPLIFAWPLVWRLYRQGAFR